MSSMTMKAPSAAIRGKQLFCAKNVAMRPRIVVQRQRLASKIAASVQYDYDTKVFKKELVKFADTEEYIYRWVLRH